MISWRVLTKPPSVFPPNIYQGKVSPLATNYGLVIEALTILRKTAKSMNTCTLYGFV